MNTCLNKIFISVLYKTFHHEVERRSNEEHNIAPNLSQWMILNDFYLTLLLVKGDIVIMYDMIG